MPEPPTEHGGSIKRFAGLVFALTLLSGCGTLRETATFSEGEPSVYGTYDVLFHAGEPLPSGEFAEIWGELKEDGTWLVHVVGIMPNGDYREQSFHGRFSLGEPEAGCTPIMIRSWDEDELQTTGQICEKRVRFDGPDGRMSWLKRPEDGVPPATLVVVGDYVPVSVEGATLPRFWSGRPLRKGDILQLRDDGTARFVSDVEMSGGFFLKGTFGGVYALTESEESGPGMPIWEFSIRFDANEESFARGWDGTFSEGILTLRSGEVEAIFKKSR